MKEIFILLFGREGEDVYTTIVDGIEWYPAIQICKLLWIKDVSSTMGGRMDNLTLFDGIDKRKFRDRNVNRNSDVWFISEKGFWKLMASSKVTDALMFRVWVVTKVMPPLLHHLVELEGVAEMGYRRLFRG